MGFLLRKIIIGVLVLTLMSLLPILTHNVSATSWASSVGLPGPDPNNNLLPNILQTSNFSAGQGSRWLVWEKITPMSKGQIYLMTHNKYGWSGQSALVSDSYDNNAPALGELSNGTIILVWSRGTGSAGTYDLYWMGYNGLRWTTPSALVQAAGDDLTPDITRLIDGTLWLVWSRSTFTNGGGDILYKTFDGSSWSSENLLSGSTSFGERFPSITQSSDGRVLVFYVSDFWGNDQLWWVAWNGLSWNQPARLTSAASIDDYPSVAEDRSGVLWVFWSRELATNDPQNPYQFDIFYANSTDLGATWSPESQVAVPKDTSSDELRPSLAQAADKTLWVVYSSDQALSNPYGTFNLYLLRSGTILGHDMAVTGLKSMPGNPRQGDIATVYVTVTNLGDYAETSVVVKLYLNSTLQGQTSIGSIAAGIVNRLAFAWNTSGLPLARFQLVAKAYLVPGEVSTQNNQLSSSILVVSPGDVNRDAVVNVLDVTLIAIRIGSSQGTAGYWADADLNHDGIINILDLIKCSRYFGAVG